MIAGPGAVIVAIVVMAGMTQWVPGGSANIDNLVLPLVLVPLIWAALFFHACLDRSVTRVAIVALALLVVNGGMVAYKFANGAKAAETAR
jgi:hypothetical protein